MGLLFGTMQIWFRSKSMEAMYITHTYQSEHCHTASAEQTQPEEQDIELKGSGLSHNIYTSAHWKTPSDLRGKQP